MTRIGVVADIHLTRDTEEEATEALENLAEQLREEELDLIVGLGDFIGDAVSTVEGEHEEEKASEQDIENIGKVKDIIDSIGAETVYLRGNHEQMLSDEQTEDALGDRYGAMEVDGQNIIWLDTAAPHVPGSRGETDEEQREWLDEKLSDLEDAIMFIHHPIHYTELEDSYWFDIYPERAFCCDKKEINNIIQKHENVEVVFNAHIHIRDYKEYKGAHHFTVPPFVEEKREEGFDGSYTVYDTEAGEVTMKDPEGVIEEHSI